MMVRMVLTSADQSEQYGRLKAQPWGVVSGYLGMSRVTERAIETAPPRSSILDAILSSEHPVVRLAEPHFAVLGKEVRVSSENAKEFWTRMALGDGNAEKAFAVALGYAVVGIMLALYLNVLTVGTVKSAGRAVRSAVRQQLLVIKVRDAQYRAVEALAQIIDALETRWPPSSSSSWSFSLWDAGSTSICAPCGYSPKPAFNPD